MYAIVKTKFNEAQLWRRFISLFMSKSFRRIFNRGFHTKQIHVWKNIGFRQNVSIYSDIYINLKQVNRATIHLKCAFFFVSFTKFRLESKNRYHSRMLCHIYLSVCKNFKWPLTPFYFNHLKIMNEFSCAFFFALIVAKYL